MEAKSIESGKVEWCRGDKEVNMVAGERRM